MFFQVFMRKCWTRFCFCFSFFKYRKKAVISPKLLFERTMSSFPPPSKPLNVLVYTGEDPKNGICERYISIENNLKYCLNPSSYIVYNLLPSQIKDPWQYNLKLLVLSACSMDVETSDVFENYARDGGHLLIFCTPLTWPMFSITSGTSEKKVQEIIFDEIGVVCLLHGGVIYNGLEVCTAIGHNSAGCNAFFKIKIGNSIIIASEVHLELDPSVLKCFDDDFTTLNKTNSMRLDILKHVLSDHFFLDCSEQDLPKLTASMLFVGGNENIHNVVSKILNISPSSMAMKLIPFDCSSGAPMAESTNRELIVAYNFQESIVNEFFNIKDYFSNLKTHTFGKLVFYIQVIGSTMDVINSLQDLDSACVVARQQIQGRGRSGNKWISPVGSASFSTHFSLSLSSPLGQRLPLVQHMIGLSVVKAVKKIPGYENIELGLKWPNDIYFNKVKIGGVLATSTIQGSSAHILTGCGINVANSQPTLCINDIIKQYNNSTGSSLPPISVECLISLSLTEFESIINDFQANGDANFFAAYYSSWLHTRQRVVLKSTGEEVTIKGLDDYGFLVVVNDTGHETTLLPDSNSFDMLRGIILPK